ncbi:bifunctional 4-hydroxy-2-oxoglutarate aldolase/2-dehydro-3-deoxy-phosphogluconate aldolase [Aquipseudomonas campi]
MTDNDNSQPPRMAEKIVQIDQLCARARIMPVITIARETDILPLADALAEGGLSVLEITLRSAHGLTAIRRLRKERPELCVGAGTVLDRTMLAAVEEAGAQFIVTPGSTTELLEAALHSPLPMLPGVSSASEIMIGYALGYRRFKFFPAELCGGAAVLKALGGPFGDVRFCPTGGINPGNLHRYVAQPNVMCVGGTWMFDSAWVTAGDWTRIRQCSQEAVRLLDSLGEKG